MGRNLIRSKERRLVYTQKRGLSDNLFFRWLDATPTARQKFYFCITAKSCHFHLDRAGALAGYIFMLEKSPISGLPWQKKLIDFDALDFSKTKNDLAKNAKFAVAFRLLRNGRVTFRVPKSFQDQEVMFDNGERLPPEVALRPLVAQCFYFLRDITHRHYHHSKRSDALTSVWAVSDPTRWIRETLFELHRRAIVARRVRGPQGQEDAMGIIAYANAFEEVIAGPQRDKLADKTLIPSFAGGPLKDSLTAQLEVKRRKRVQRNVVAAAFPAFLVATLALALRSINSLEATAAPSSTLDWVRAIKDHPLRVFAYVMAEYEWSFVILLVAGGLWVLAHTEQLVPSEHWWVKPTAQTAANFGKVMGVFTLLALGLATCGIIYFLIFLT